MHLPFHMPAIALSLTPSTVIAFVLGALFAAAAIFVGGVVERLRLGVRRGAPSHPPVENDRREPRYSAPRKPQRSVRPNMRRQRIPVEDIKPARAAAARDVHERDDIRDWLIGMGYPERAATKASRAARASLPDATIDQQISEALSLLPAESN